MYDDYWILMYDDYWIIMYDDYWILMYHDYWILMYDDYWILTQCPVHTEDLQTLTPYSGVASDQCVPWTY
jgi:hypothetical protein